MGFAEYIGGQFFWLHWTNQEIILNDSNKKRGLHNTQLRFLFCTVRSKLDCKIGRTNWAIDILLIHFESQIEDATYMHFEIYAKLKFFVSDQ